MPVKKRRTHHGKQFRGSQDSQQARNYDNTRLKPEQVGRLVHDESDTISYRSYLLQNFMISSELIDVLTTQAVPVSKIKPPRIYPSMNLEAVKQAIEVEKQQILAMVQATSEYKVTYPDKYQILRQSSSKLTGSDVDHEMVEKVSNEFAAAFNKVVQDDRFVIHQGKFLELRGDVSEAPPDYWSKYKEIAFQKRQRALQIMQAAEEQKKKETEEAELRQRTAEAAVFDDHLDKNSEAAEMHSEGLTNQAMVPPEQQNGQTNHEQAHPAMLGSIFGDLNGDTFNNGFEDEFADLDTAFF
ncbi:LAMI_0C01464g1_1 [Lachancea mirantina]|uniref:LAMI_0C01464g1_1 n=1 Tax=Lachancea mirantina TaxID=1230905 RepID=A0A1G4J065_9SACH|nr:LAMI_0C01464g1_1 [Lachancea mirantina]